MKGPLSGKKALVTGAAGGIGLIAARALGQTGCGLYVVGQKFANIYQVANDLRSTYAVETEMHLGNIANSVDAEAIGMACADADIYINCTGNLPRGTLEDIEDERWRKSWEAAVFGPLNMVREMIGHMGDEERGLIVLMIDAPAEVQSDDLCASAAGAVLTTVIQGLAQDLPQGVRILGLNTLRAPDAQTLSEAITRLALSPDRFTTGSIITTQDILSDDDADPSDRKTEDDA